MGFTNSAAYRLPNLRIYIQLLFCGVCACMALLAKSAAIVRHYSKTAYPVPPVSHWLGCDSWGDYWRRHRRKVKYAKRGPSIHLPQISNLPFYKNSSRNFSKNKFSNLTEPHCSVNCFSFVLSHAIVSATNIGITFFS